ncbi:hypothetical protein HF324_18850 [Chitinophaga oryzae]|uniref:GLPGLI family protein n=1 Tax=Chitinophaga oryzae TaxID=2725414 RepID=A0AAE7D7Y2_9BACT|nr:hypothetical protein [Chitinophaga oryzae]QJB33285.1 hypothetical protein HF329_18985 [Chitinophaga oryzae]QJB39805.1 hypothetical protein HF324_18850 [Chitinophaga oryzae]
MKTLLLLLAGIACSWAATAQTVIKVQPPSEPFRDSVVYQGDNVVLIFDRQHLLDYMITMDTTLRNNKNSNKVFRNIQFAKLNANDMANHFLKAYCFLEDTLNKEINFRTDRMNLLWAEDCGILMPYVEEILPDLLATGNLKIVERGSKIVQPAYKLIFEPINNNNYRVFRMNNGKEIFRESTFCVEQITHR